MTGDRAVVRSSEQTPRLGGIESLRALAATMIIIYHMVLLPNPDMPIPAYLDFIKTKFGLGVPLFYVLSGFVLAYGYIDKLNSRQNAVKFYIRRFFRIAPLFYLMIIVWMIVATIRSGSFNLDLHDLVLNVTFLFGFVPGKHESMVWAGWSIGIEMIFYLIFPIIAILVRNVRSAILIFAVSLLVGSDAYKSLTAAGIGSFAYMNLLTHMPYFTAGVLAFEVWKAMGLRESRGIGLALLAASLIASILLITLPGVASAMAQVKGMSLALYCWSAVFLALVLSVALWQPAFIVNRLSTKLGSISFSLYLLHPPAIVLLRDVYKWVHAGIGSDLMSFLCNAVITMTIVSVASLVTFRFVEMPGMAWGRRVAHNVN